MTNGSGNACDELTQAVDELDRALMLAKVDDPRVRRSLEKVKGLVKKRAGGSPT